MVRFSCFNAHIHRHKSKKTLDCSSKRLNEAGPTSNSSSSFISGKSHASAQENGKPVGLAALERGWKSEEIKADINLQHDVETQQIRRLKKSQSHGDELYLDGRDASEGTTDDGKDHMISPDSLERNGKDHAEGSPPSLSDKAPLSVSNLYNSDRSFNGSDYPVEDPQNADKDSRRCEDSSFSGDRVDDSNSHSPRSSPVPDIADSINVSGKPSLFKCSSDRYRSHDDLLALDMRHDEKSVPDTKSEARQEEDQINDMHKSGDNNIESFSDEGDDAYGYSSMAKDWIVPVTDELKSTKFHEGESSNQQLEYPSKDFKIKRIEEWVNDLQYLSTPDESDESPEYDNEVPREPVMLNGSTTAKADLKLTPGMEAAKKYVSSLSASASTAQLINHGLAVIPFLSAFVGLRALNLSGNSIVRITAGALPRGLHVLNLSKNSISTIEGLRELTRLRVLDLSYNRILRIGHGLASCSSLKELYMAGNKISEVEGLHRLLKLTVLDLRFNKISTTKCLGQLAANYNSLQAISLEGNPAQKNVGDEQLKKYLMGLLPNLAYFNRHAIKDASDRRLGVSTHQLERGHRSEIKKSSRKSSHGGHKASSSTAAARRTQAGAAQKRSKDRSSRLPPVGQKGPVAAAAAAAYENHYAAVSNRLASLRSELSMRRSRSEGTLGAF